MTALSSNYNVFSILAVILNIEFVSEKAGFPSGFSAAAQYYYYYFFNHVGTVYLLEAESNTPYTTSHLASRPCLIDLLSQ